MTIFCLQIGHKGLLELATVFAQLKHSAKCPGEMKTHCVCYIPHGIKTAFADASKQILQENSSSKGEVDFVGGCCGWTGWEGYVGEGVAWLGEGV